MIIHENKRSPDMRFKSGNSYEKHDYGINIGLSSLLLIFTVLCLVSFATLAIASACADKRLNDKITERTRAYYAACNTAEEDIAACDGKLCASYKTGVSEDGYFSKWGHSIDISVPINDTQSLNVTLTVLFPSDKNGPFYRIASWKTENTGTTELDTTLPVLK